MMYLDEDTAHDMGFVDGVDHPYKMHHNPFCYPQLKEAYQSGLIEGLVFWGQLQTAN
jgi:hypothetical protein